MTINIYEQLKNWTSYMQKKNKKNFYFLEKNYLNENYEKIFFFKEPKNQTDKRIFIGALRYIPSIISNFLKKCPMPWNLNLLFKNLIHQTGVFFILNNFLLVSEFIFSTQWSVWWIINKKAVFMKKNFKRIIFPPLDDEESLLSFSGLKHIRKKTILKKKDNLSIYQILKEWFYATSILFSSFLKKKKKKLIFLDLPLCLSFFKIQFLSSLRFNPKNFLGIGKKKFFSKFQLLNQIKKKFLKDTKVKSNFFSKHTSKKHNNLFECNFLLPQNKSTFDFKIYDKTNHFDIKKAWPDFLSNQTILIFKKNEKLEKKLSKKISQKIKENFLKIPDYFCPFFFDLFFSESQTKFIFKTSQFLERRLQRIHTVISPHKIPLIRKLIIEFHFSSDINIFSSYHTLLKNYFFNCSSKKFYFFQKKISFISILNKNYCFSSYETNWIDSGVRICIQGFNMLVLLLGRKNLFFLNLDYNFNLKPTKTLTTKERKKSRFSNSFHLTREILRFVKILIDCHLQFKIGNIDSFQLSDAVHYVFTHVGFLTGIYRYKYKTLKQIFICKLIKKILYQKFYKNGVKNFSGFGFWAPVWRVWVFFLKGVVPLLERWLSNLLSRHFYGRKGTKKSFENTKQRAEAYFDIGFKRSFFDEIHEEFNSKAHPLNLKNCIKHLNEAWKCWKSGISWKIPFIPKNFTLIIFKYIKIKADWWIKRTYYYRNKIRKGNVVDKTLIKKNLGKITRLWFKAEKKRQYDFLEFGPYLSKQIASVAFEILSKWIDLSGIITIEFPSLSTKMDIKFLTLALENIKENEILNSSKIYKKKDEEKTLEKKFENPFETLFEIKEKLLTQRNFCEIGVNFTDNFSNLLPIFRIEIQENLTDAFIAQYLWYQSTKIGLFPNWSKPSDKEITPFFVYKICSSIHKVGSIFKYSFHEKFFFFQGYLIDTFENIELVFLNQLLRIIMAPNLAIYVSSRFNVKLFHKDMLFTNCIGLVQGLFLYPFVLQFYILLIDLCLLGIQNALFLKFRNIRQNNQLKFMEGLIRILFYSRYLSEIIIMVKDNKILKNNIKKKNFSEINLKNKNCTGYKFFLEKFKKAIPFSLGKIFFYKIWKKNKIMDFFLPIFRFSLCGFDIFTNFFSFKKKKKNFWFFGKKNLIKKTYIFVSLLGKLALVKFENRMRQILFNSNSTTFTKIVNKWNSNLLGIILYFRESCWKNFKFQKVLLQSEKKVQMKIKLGLNSKMPSRFPPVLFYSPKELGGLGMICVARSSIHKSDLKYSKKKNGEPTSFFSYEEKSVESIPTINMYIPRWENEFFDSKIVWKEFLKRRSKKFLAKIQISVDDIDDLWDRGIPRINTLFQKDRHTLAYDFGWRIKGNFKKYQQIKLDPFWWTNHRHDGKLWNLNLYRIDVIHSLGGVENILEHTLFKGAYFPSWEGLFWEKTSVFENSFNKKKITNAQRSGLNQIPNRRFTLWWSPTINRGNVYIGFQVQLDLTGIFMHGKIPTLKISLTQIFRAHLWQKIHESLILNLCQKLDDQMKFLNIQTIQKEQIHPRKSYRLNLSCADIVLFGRESWVVSAPTLMSFSKTEFNLISFFQTNIFWLDIQLRWGNFDTHDIERYSREKFLDYSTDKNSIYPCSYGLIIAFDLCYNIFSVFGYWFKGLKLVIGKTLAHLTKTNPSLFTLRERIRKGLQLCTTEHNLSVITVDNFSEIFNYRNTWFVDDSCFYRVSIHKTKNGNIIGKPMNGALLIFLPNSGLMYVKVSHLDIWKRKKRMIQFSRWKVAEELSFFLNSFPITEQPQLLVATRKTILDPIEIQLTSNSNILVKGTEIRVSFQSFLRIKNIANQISNSSSSRLIIYHLYENWLESNTTFTSFSRIILIFRSIEIDFERVKIIFDGFKILSSKNKFWPDFSDSKWIKIENLLRDLILEDYSKKKKINAKHFSQNDIRNIILGFEHHKLFETKEENKKGTQHLEKVSFPNKFGKNIQISVLSKKEKENLISWTNWRVRYLIFSKFRFFRIKIECLNFLKKVHNYILPNNLIKHFIGICDPHFYIGALLFGTGKIQKKKFTEIRIFIIPPQISDNDNLEIGLIIPRNYVLNNLIFLGLIRTSSKKDKLPKKNDGFIINSLVQKNFRTDKNKIVLLIINFFEKNCEISGFLFKNFKNFLVCTPEDSKISIFLSSRFFGFFLTPKKIGWNFLFRILFFFREIKYSVFMKIPYSFYHHAHNSNF
ncbi:splicing factor Prp8 (nucleomorph) [Chroomonas mesostigmatica CCMP1168]|uniref:Splicing factor Prp8 n=1 Tax=Chroomonas mesostigmatica CCMP1168 TaxID=1195612 RepID=J7G7K3_9CRYP|nr:splicing factor Prp8 [Chroomonas mesostigmatica CCMP1168]